jgi:hypothetical protein
MKNIESVSMRIKSKHVLMLFDSCFSGSLFNLVRAMPQDITEKSASPVRQYITAGRGDEQVPDRSMFKRCLLIGLEGDADLTGDGYITGTELGMYLSEKVVNYTRSLQHPQYGKINNPDLDRGDFIFVPKQAPQPSMAHGGKTAVQNQPEESVGNKVANLQSPDDAVVDSPSERLQGRIPKKYKLAIFPWKISLAPYYPPSTFYINSFRAILDAAELNPELALEFSYYRHPKLQAARVVYIDKELPEDDNDFWSKKSFFSHLEPNLNTVVDYGNKIKTDLAILYSIDMRIDSTVNYLYIVDIHTKRVYVEKFASTGASEEKIKAAIENIYTALKTKTKRPG